MENKLFEKLDDLNIKDTKLLLEENIDLSIDLAARKRIQKVVMKKTGYYKKQPKNKNKINNILGEIIMKRKIALVLSAAFVLSLAGGGYAYAKTPVAYVSVDINPSIEVGVNAFDTVVSVEAYNEDGGNILEGTDLLNVKVDEAVGIIVTNAISDGYIQEDGSSAIEITTSTDKTDVAAELDQTLKDVVDETLNNNNLEAEVEAENVALARRDEARKLGITPGKLNLIQKLQALDSTITVEEYRNSSIKDIQKKTKELRKNGIDEISTQDGTSIATTSSNTSDIAATNTTESNNEIDAVVSTEESIVEKGNKKASNGKENNKKEEVNTIEEEVSEPAVVEKQNKSENSNSQSSNNSLKEDKGNDVNSDNNNSAKSENTSKDNSSKSNSSSSGNGSSNSQGKGKNK